MPQGQSGECVLDWKNREGFLATSTILLEGEFWYIIGYSDFVGGPIQKVNINPKKHYAHFGVMPLEMAPEYFEFYGRTLTFLGLEQGSGRAWRDYSNHNGADAGEVIGGHNHNNVTPALHGKPSSGMGLNLMEKFYNTLDELMAAMLADLDALRLVPDATTHDYVVKVAFWTEKREEFLAAKERADAYKR